MCGIAGIVGISANRRVLSRMLARIRHRGPDGEGTFAQGGMAFAHARLSIIDLTDAAAQPMHDPDTGNVIIYNGEIYNYADIARELGSGPAGMSRGDTAALLRAYGRWGVDALARLRGMFAFAIWDAARRKVFLARDRFGMKPLYYRRIGDALLFASEIRPLLFAEYPHTANEGALASFLAFRQLDITPQTCFHEVHQIPPAHCAWVSLDGTISPPQRYWAPPRFGTSTFQPMRPLEVRDAFVDSVLKHMRSDVPVGCFVSGGIDSSAIACTAAKMTGPGELSSFSSILGENCSNTENRLIPPLLREIGSTAHNLTIDGREFMDDLPAVFDCHEEPLADASMYAHWRLCRLARDAGIRVVLSGNGGDEVFGGYGAHLHGCIGSLIARGRFVTAARQIAAFHRMGLGSVTRLMTHGLHEALPIVVKTAYKRREAGRALAGSAFAPLAEGIGFYNEHGADPLENVFLEHLEHWSVPAFLHYEDRNGMAFGVEVRTPILDHELLAAVWQFDPVSLLQGRSKHALRAAMRGVVPDEVLDQPGKFGFAAPLDLYVTTAQRNFREMYHDLVAACPYFDATVAGAILDDFYAGRKIVVLPWRIFSVALWYDRFIRRTPDTSGATGAASQGTRAG